MKNADVSQQGTDGYVSRFPPDFYASQSTQSDPGMSRDEMLSWPKDVPATMKIVQGLLIYDAVTKPFYDCDLSPTRQAAIHTRTVEAILTHAKALDSCPLTSPRSPERRIASRCNNFNLLLISALCAHGLPTRARCGYATCFKADSYEDHWICEY